MKYIIVTFVLLAVAASAGNTGTISGFVTDINGNPINGALITVKGVNRFITSNADGYFVLNGVPAGYYDVLADRIGYGGMLVLGVRVIADTRTNVAFTLDVGCGGPVYIRAEESQIRMNKTRTEYIYEAADFIYQ